MDLTSTFRHRMMVRLLRAAGVVALTAPAIQGMACSSSVVGGGTSGGPGAGGTGGTGDASATVTTGVGPSTGTGIVQNVDYGPECKPESPPSILRTDVCIAPVDGVCLDPVQAASAVLKKAMSQAQCVDIASIQCGPVLHDGLCCYLADLHAGCAGRPFLVDDRARAAELEHGNRGWSSGLVAPDTTGLDRATRSALAAAWAADALLEHASIAAFSRFSLELLAVGAPADLVAGAHEAARDEVHHASLCFALARGYSGAPMGPAAFPFDGSIALRCDLLTLAASTAREGCIEETVSAILAAEQLARATDPAVRAALTTIAEDEARHAELAFRTVAWAMERGGAPVREAVAAVLADSVSHSTRLAEDSGSPSSVLAEHGRLGPGEAQRARRRALDEVIRPCFAALLAGSPATATMISATA